MNTLQDWLDDGWKVTSDGPNGMQLERKTMKGLDKACLVLGVLTLIWGIGVFFIIIALIDYFALTKPEVKFIAR